MAKYTVCLGDVINSGRKLSALENYPIYNEDFRKDLNNMILHHFWFREIGFETVELFDFYLGATMNEIMPYYNKLFVAADMIVDPLANHVFHEESVNSSTQKSEQGTGSNGNSKQVYSKPADGIVHMTELEENVYASDVTFGKTDNSSKTNYDGSGTQNYRRDASGTIGMSQAEMFNRYRKSVVNVVQLILADKELNRCFMGVY